MTDPPRARLDAFVEHGGQLLITRDSLVDLGPGASIAGVDLPAADGGHPCTAAAAGIAEGHSVIERRSQCKRAPKIAIIVCIFEHVWMHSSTQ